jgi:Ankyrin repeats (3 copies)
MRTLKGIPKEKQQHARRLLQCLVAAVRPLRVEELAQVLTINFDPDSGYHLVDKWRPENPQEEVLSTCSTLICVTDHKGGKLVQFSHFSVKEFLTSDRLRISEIENDFHFYISPNDAHTTLAQACLTILLQLDQTTEKRHLLKFPLALYAAQHWADHIKVGNVVSRNQDAMEILFEPKKPYFRAWVWIRGLDGRGKHVVGHLAERPSRPEQTPLYYAAHYGFIGLAKRLIVTHGEDVNAKCGLDGSPLHAASVRGHIDVARLLLDHGADVNLRNGFGGIPLRRAYDGRHFEVMRLLLEHGADVDVRNGNFWGTLLHDSSYHGQAEIVHLLLQHDADVNARGLRESTPLHFASQRGYTEVAQILLEYGADVNAKDKYSDTPLDDATQNHRHGVVRLLLEHGTVEGDGHAI